MRSAFFRNLKKYGLLLIAAALPLVVSLTAIGFNLISRHFVDLPRHGFVFALMPKYDQPIRYTVVDGNLLLGLDSKF